MGTIKIWNESEGRYNTITFNLVSSVLDDGTDGAVDYYITIKCDWKSGTGSTLPTVLVRTLSDSPTGAAYANWTELINAWVHYFVEQGELGMSTSSSSTSSYIQVWSSSSSSSTSSYIEEWSSSSSSSSSSSDSTT